MKKKFFFILLIFLASLGFSDVRISPFYDEKNSIIKVRVDFSPLKIKWEGTYSVISSDGCHDSYTTDKPKLPIKSIFLALPPNVSVKDINILPEQIQIEGEYNIPLALPPIPISQNPQSVIRNLQLFDGIFPENVAEIGKIQCFRGYSLLPINVFAGQCDGKRLYWNRTILIEINLKKPKILSTPELFRGDDKDKAFIETLVVNPELIQKYKPLKKKTPITEYQYVIITDQSLQSAFQPLINNKIARGITATIKTTQWIYETYQGRDDQERIRNFIKNYYTHHSTEYVLLGGDVELVPYRGVYAEVDEYIDHDIPADIYFSCLDGDWNNDGDNIFGELIDDVDLFPDVYVGRAPVNTIEETEAFVRKVLVYQGILKELLIAWMADSQSDCADIKEEIAEYTPGYYTIYKEYESAGGVDKNRIINYINQGLGLINHAGHAHYWVVPPFNIEDVDALENKDLFIFYTVGCFAGKLEEFDCIGEHFINNQNGGAVAFIGNSRYGWYEFGNPKKYSGEYDIEFFKKFFEEEYINIGKTLAWSKIGFIPHSDEDNPYRWIMFCLNLLGDPEMIIEGSYANVLLGKVLRADTNEPISNAIVRISGGEGSATTSSLGTYVLNMPSDGTYTIIAERDGCFSTTTTIYIKGPVILDFYLVPQVTYSISGYVKTFDDARIEGVEMDLEGETGRKAFTNSSGYFELTSLLPGNYTISPYKLNYIFTPSSRTYKPLNSNEYDQNFTSLPHLYKVDPPYGPVKSIVHLAGNGFGSDDMIQIDFGITQTIATCSADTFGEFLTSFVVDSQSLGTQIITARGLYSNLIVTSLFSIVLPYSISGFTKNASGHPISGIQVTLISDEGTIATISNENGKYIFNNLSAKAYTITAEDGFSPKDRIYSPLNESLINQNFYKKEEDNPPWPLWGYNSQRTGVSPYATKGLYPKWIFDTKNISLSYPIIGYDGTIYSGPYAIDPENGVGGRFGQGVFITPSCIGKDGTIYGLEYEFDECEGYKHYLCAVWPDGELYWKCPIGGIGDDFYSFPVIGTDGTIYVGSRDGYLYAISQEGELIWRYDTGFEIRASPALGEDGTIYISNSRVVPNSEFFAITSDGELKWQYELEGWSHRASPSVWKDRVYIEAGVWLYCLSAEDGSLKWRFGGLTRADNSPAVDEDGTVYLASNFLYALTKDGNVKWRYPLVSDGISPLSPVIDPNGIIYVAGIQERSEGFAGVLYAITRDGELLASYEAPSFFEGCSISPDGTIYALTALYRLYALSGKPGYTIRGHINTLPIYTDMKIKEGVLVKLEGTINATFTTGADGFYIFTKLPPGSYTITPTKQGFYFIPESQTCIIQFQDKTIDFLIAEDAPYYIKGRVKEANGSYLAGVKISLNGRITYTDQNGVFQFTQLTKGTYTLFPEKTGYIFIPSQWTYELFCSQDDILFLGWKKNVPIYGQFLADSKHTGRVPYQGVSAPQLFRSSTLTDFPTSPLVAADGTIYTNMGGKLVAFDKNSRVKWKSNIGTLSSTYPAIGPDGTIYVVCDDEYLYALNPNNTKKWQCKINGIPSRITISNDGNILLVSDKLYSISPLGNITWTYPICGSLAQGDDGSIYITGNDGILYSLTKDGNLRWQMSAPPIPNSSSILDEQGTLSISGYIRTEGGMPVDRIMVYLSSRIELTDTRGYYRFDNLSSGKYYRVIPYHPEYRFEPPDRIYNPLINDMENQDFIVKPSPPVSFFASPPAISDNGTIYIGGKNGIVYCLIDNFGTYTVKWMIILPEKEDITLPPVIGLNGDVYITQQGRLYSLDPSDGKINWIYIMARELGYIFHPPLIDNEGMLYFIGNFETLIPEYEASIIYSLTPKGKVRWKWQLPRPMRNPPNFYGSEIALANGKIYLGAEEFGWGFKERYYLYTISSFPQIVVTISPNPFVVPIRSFSYPMVSVFDIYGTPIVDRTPVRWEATVGHLQGYPNPMKPVVYTENGTCSIQFFSEWKPYRGTLTAMVWEGEANKAEVCLIITQDDQYISSIEVIPSEVEIPTGKLQTFLAVAWDNYSNEMFDLPFSWEISPSILGTISPRGTSCVLFASKPGIGSIAATYGGIYGYASITVFPSPYITLQKSANKERVSSGETVTYTITYKNEGNETAMDVVIIDVLPRNTELQSVEEVREGITVNYFVGGVWKENFGEGENVEKIKWEISEVAEGQEETVSFTVIVK